LDIAEKDYLACFKYFLASIPRFNRGQEKIIRTARSFTGRKSFARKNP
jgi:hypothetical protein